LVRIDVGKSSYHQLSQNEIGSDNPCSRHLSGISDFLLLAIQIAEGLDAAHAEGGFMFGVLMSGKVRLSCQLFNRAESSRAAKDWASNARGSPEPDSWLGVSYASPPSSPDGNAHECHSSSSTCVSQNQRPHLVQPTVAG